LATRRKHSENGGARDGFDRIRLIFNIIAALVALGGLADAAYLTVAHLVGDTSVCGPSQGCPVVLSSVYASIGGIPTAAFGVVGYFSAFSAATLAAFGYARARIFLIVIVSGMFAVTLWLLYLQAFVLHAFCPFCLLSAAFTFCLAGLTLATPPGQKR
jgi:uncharacterized membrane protein